MDLSGHGEVVDITITRRDGKLGIELDDSNRVTDVGPASRDGLKMWDMVRNLGPNAL